MFAPPEPGSGRIILRGIPLLGLEETRLRQEWVSVFEPNESIRAPQLTVAKTSWTAQLASSLEVLFREPAPPKKFVGAPFFRDCWIDQRFPKQAFAAAVSLQILLILFPPPIWSSRPPRRVAPHEMEMTWYGPVRDFPAILPSALRLKSAPRKNEIVNAQSHRTADAFHPRQTILSAPLHPTHPRQTLIQPSSLPEPPKILPELPNIVQLASSQPSRPRPELTAMRPKAPAQVVSMNVSVPEISALEKHPGAISIAASTSAPAKPALPISPMSAPRAATRQSDSNVAAPEIRAPTPAGSTVIALSATPALAPSPPVIPAGNLSARISISPDGTTPGAPGDTATSNASGGSRGPDGIFISGGNKSTTAATAGLGIGSATRGIGNPLPSRPTPRLSAPEDSNASPFNSSSPKDISKVDALPEKILGAKQVYTLHVNMPNLTSASGSWILNFAELNEADATPYSRMHATELVGPVPQRKVDPKYPPELRTLHVDGEVILYAIIRKDGSVDSIQLVHGVDPRLDANAMEALAQWKFKPAEKHGEPVDLEAVVRIPFRSRAPGF
jgi:TonB family protein